MKKNLIFALIMICSMNLNGSQNSYTRKKFTLNSLLDMNGFGEDERPRFEAPYQSACPERVSSFPVNIRLEDHDDYYMPALSKSELISLVSSSSHTKTDKMEDFLRSLKLCHMPESSTGKFKEPVYELTELGKYLVSQISVDIVSCNNHSQEEEID